MPFSVIVAILSLFVLLIGPLDYFILGRLKRRYLTWILFPVVSVGFMLYTIRLSRSYMGSADYGNALVFMDVGDRGEVVRTNRYEVLFPAGERDVATDVRSGLFTAMDRERFGGGSVGYGGYPPPSDYYGWEYEYGYDYDPYGGRRVGGPGMVLPEYRGRIPARFQALQKVHQWTPQLNRVFSLEPSEAGKDIDWHAVTMASLRGRDVPGENLESLLGKRASETAVYLFHQDRVKCLHQGMLIRITEEGARRHRQHRLLAPFFPSVFFRHASVRPQVGLFSVISSISPTGGADFEDLTVLDPTDENEFLLVLIRQSDNDYHIFRKLYKGG
jgi:hypothetical protein